MLAKAVQITPNQIMFPNGTVWEYPAEDVCKIAKELIAINSVAPINVEIGFAIGVAATLGSIYVIYKLTHHKENISEK